MSFSVIDTSREAWDHYGYGYGADFTKLTKQHLAALLTGKSIVIDDGEYVHFIVLDATDTSFVRGAGGTTVQSTDILILGKNEEQS
jgi:hypothetical protein